MTNLDAPDDGPSRVPPSARRAAASVAAAPARAMLVAQLHLLEKSMPSIVVGTFVAGAILVVALHDDLSPALLGAWAAALSLLSVVRVLWLRRCLAHPTDAANARPRLALATLLSMSSAALWGLLGFVAVMPDDPFTTLMVVMVLTGLVASATAVLAHLTVMYLPYILLMMAPAAVRFLMVDEPEQMRWIGGLILFYLLVSWTASRATGAAVRDSIALRFANDDLISDLREGRHALEDALAAEARASAAKSRFLAAASHDLRQPLHSLRLFAATLAGHVLEPRPRRLVSMIEASVTALQELFDAILDISRLDAGTLVAERTHVPLDGTLARLEMRFGALARERGLAFVIERSEAVVHTDPVLFERLLSNLLDNALRYTDTGEVRLTIDGRTDGRVRIDVLDTGRGIPAADRGRVFEEFVQLDNPERDRSQGIGLGLSIVLRIAALLDIELALEPADGGGTRASLSVPVGERRRIAPDTEREREVGERGRDAPMTLAVLVIDDEESARAAMEVLFESWGCVVAAASSGPEAVRVLTETGCVPDVVVSDYRLREGERGSEAIERVRGHCGRAIPGIIVTGDIAPDRLRELESSALPVLHKPTDPARLRALLEREGARGGPPRREE